MKAHAHVLNMLLLCGCASSPKGAEAPPPEAKQKQGTMQGGISEEAFKALHEHRTDAPPEPKGEMIQLGGERAYLSLPADAKAPMPAVIVIHEWWGLNENVMHWADRLANEGYAALAVDLYHGKVTKQPDEAMALMKSVDRAEALATLGEAYQFVAEDERIQATKRASIGWCFGGGWSLNMSLAMPMDATVIYYGHLVTDPAELESLKGPVLGIFGQLDEGIPPPVVDEFDQALDRASVNHQILRFEANHAFANPSSGRYDQEAAAKAWEAVRPFLAQHLTSDPE